MTTEKAGTVFLISKLTVLEAGLRSILETGGFRCLPRADVDQIKPRLVNGPFVAMVALAWEELSAALLALERSGLTARSVLVMPEADCLAFLDALRTGVAGLLTYRGSAEEIRRSAWSVMRGRKYLCSRYSDLACELTLAGQSPTLTHREIQVLRLVSLGYREKEISQALGLSPHTVHTHKRKLMAKLKVRSQLRLVEIGRRLARFEPRQSLAAIVPMDGQADSGSDQQGVATEAPAGVLDAR